MFSLFSGAWHRQTDHKEKHGNRSYKPLQITLAPEHLVNAEKFSFHKRCQQGKKLFHSLPQASKGVAEHVNWHAFGQAGLWSLPLTNRKTNACSLSRDSHSAPQSQGNCCWRIPRAAQRVHTGWQDVWKNIRNVPYVTRWIIQKEDCLECKDLECRLQGTLNAFLDRSSSLQKETGGQGDERGGG